MGFTKGKFARIWKVEDKGNYSVAEVSVSKKNKETEQYETEWSNKFVRLVGHAHNASKAFETPLTVKIGDCDVTNKYDKEKQITYTNYVIFGFEDADSDTSNTHSESKQSDGFMDVPDDTDSLPFN